MMPTDTIQGFSLSPQQKYIWWRQQRDRSTRYRSRAVLAIDGELTPTLMPRALRNLVERYEVLRTRFETLPGMNWPLQVVSPLARCAYLHQDLSRHDHATRERVWNQLASGDTPSFDLDDERPLQVLHVTFSAGRHLLIVELPSLCADAASLERLVRDMRSAYACCRGGRPLPPVSWQYADVAETLNLCLESTDYEAGRQFWQRDITTHVRGRAPFIDAGTPVGSFVPRVRALRLANDIVSGIVNRAAQAGVSCQSWLLACWGVLMCRLVPADEITLGLCCDGRTLEPLGDLIGPLARHVPLSFGCGRRESIVDLARRLEALCDERIGQQHYFDPNLEPHREETPSACFEYRDAVDLRDGDGPALKVLSLHAVAERFVVKLTALRDAENLRCQIEYDAAALSPRVITGLSSHLSTLLRSAIEQPEAPALHLPMLTGAEEGLLIADGTGPSRAVPTTCVHDMFAAQARLRPDAIAVELEGLQVTYAELASRSRLLARALRARGVNSDCRVALCLDRSVEMVVGMLGVLQAGGAYVPLDPDSPPERLREMLTTADAALVLALASTAGSLGHVESMLLLDRDWASIAATAAASTNGSDSSALPRVDGDNLAYVIYTSGSTGLPKATAIPHAALSNHMAWICEAFDIGPADVLLQKTAYTFDASVWEFYAPLMTGGRLVLAAPGEHRDPERLVSRLSHEQATLVQFVPSVLAEVVRQPHLDACRGLRLIFAGGEALPPELCRRTHARLGASVINLYGPTEVTIDATYWRGTSGDGDAATVPLGRPITNLQTFVVDDGGQLAPPGVPGELYLGGAGLGRGYLGQPARTAERFVPDGITGTPGARLYRTGDRVRWRAESVLEFLGRVDQQIKLRGYRIELGEIEAVLGRLPGVQRCAVALRPDVNAQPRLVAYVTLDDATTPLTTWAARWRVALLARLPEYMIPVNFVPLRHWPLTPNGKLDRAALPAPDAALPAAAPAAPPQPGLETLIAEIWAQVLPHATIGRTDNFFEVGGHSLLATQVMSRVRAACGVDLPLRTLFERPTVAGLAAAVHQTRTPYAPPPPVTPAPRSDEGLPLSYAQQRLWFLAQLDPRSPAYTIPYAVRLRGPLDEGALARALRALVARHEILRTRFVDHDGTPRQHVDATPRVALRVIDLCNVLPVHREQMVANMTREEAARPLSLRSTALLRLHLLRLEDDDRVLLVTLHHIISDAWSVATFVRELSALYDAQSADRRPISLLPDLPIQYGDFTVWQRQWLTGEVLDAQLAYWRTQLAALPPLALPTDHPRPARASHRTGVRRFTWDATLTSELRALSRREGVTLFMTLLAGLATVLARWTGQRDLAIGTDVANRHQLEIESLIGFFVNQLVLRLRLDPTASFRDLLAHVRQVALDAYAHQDVPFDRVVSALAPDRDLARAPLFQVALVLQNAPVEALQLGQARIEPILADTGAAETDLTLIVHESDGGLTGTLQFALDLFDSSTADTVLRAMRAVLAEAAGRIDAPINRLPLGDADERERLVAVGTGAAQDYPDPFTLHEMVSAWAAKTPEAIALVANGHHVTFGALDRCARQLAAFLVEADLRPGALVAVCIERSPELIVALLGTLHAGAAYLPLDPDYPEQQLAFMVADARPAVVLAHPPTAPRFQHTGTRVVDCITDWPEIAAARAPLPPADCEALAYVTYTSGSTGRPKGVMNAHSPVRNRLLWQRDTLRVTPRDRMVQKTPVTFDVSVGEIFGTLASGACLVLARPGGHREADYLLDLIAREQPTLVHFVPSMLDAFLDVARAGPCASLRAVVCSGEALTADVLRRLHAQVAQVDVYNLYGPTEAAIDVSYWRSDRNERRRTIPIGRPIANVRLTILDGDGQPQPQGFPGELAIGGLAVGRGYLNQPALTADRFRPDAYACAPGGRCYRTGDLARWNDEGEIEYLGRLDRQIKIRGLRVELGEIEAALCEQPDVRQAAVVLRDVEPGQPRLVAYVVPQTDAAADAQVRWKSGLQSRLPSHMVPGSIVRLPRLPLTPSGKVDYRALPAPDVTRPSEGATIAPRTTTERALADIWQQVLKTPSLGIHDNFFELGGDSILSLQIVARAHQEGLAFSVRDLFEHQTIASLAACLDGDLAVDASGAATDTATGPEIPLTPIQHWFFGQRRDFWHHYNQALWLTVREPLTLSALRRAWRRLGRHHGALRLRFEPTGETAWKQTIADDDGASWVTMIDVAEVAAEDRTALLVQIANRAQRSLNLSSGPIVRVLYVTTGAPAGYLYLLAHHLAVDGVSWRILLDHVQRLYDGTGSRTAHDAGLSRSSSFQARSRALARSAQTGRVRAERSWWEQEVRPPVARCPRDRDGINDGATARHHTAAWRAESTQALLKWLPRVHRQPLHIALLTALAETLGSWLDTDSVLVDLESHGRQGDLFPELDFTQTVGWLTSLFPVRLPRRPGETAARRLEAVASHLASVPNAGLGYGLLRYLTPDGGDLDSPAEVLFNYLGQLDRVLPTDGVLGPLDLAIGAHDAGLRERPYLLEINSAVRDGALWMDWTYSPAIHDEATIARLANGVYGQLDRLVESMSRATERPLQPTEFPLAGLRADQLARLAGRVRQ